MSYSENPGSSQRRLDWLVTTAALLLGVLFAMATYYLEDQDSRNLGSSLTTALAVSVLTSSWALIHSLNRRVLKNREFFLKATSEISKILELHQDIDSNREQLEALRTSLLKRSPIVQETGLDCLREYISEFRAIDNGFQMIGQDWALRSYTSFWRHLVAEQKKRNAGGGEPIRCVMTHSSSIELWRSEPRSKLLLSRQQEFCKSGGRMLRVFIYPDAEPDEECQLTMEKMIEAGIEVRYLQVSDGLQMSNDFLWVQDLDHVVTWKRAHLGNSIESCKVLDRVDDSLKNWWRLIEEELANSSSQQDSGDTRD